MVVFLAVAALVFGACGDDDGGTVREVGNGGSGTGTGSGTGSGSATGVAPACEPVGDAAGATATVDATLTEYAITLGRGAAPAGRIHFALVNRGAEPHELVVVKGVPPAALPKDADGALDESRLPAGALVGEVEAFPGGGERCDGTFELAAGTYTLLCNVVEEHDGRKVAHVAEGMVTTFTVG
jgi:hypothetical protein